MKKYWFIDKKCLSWTLVLQVICTLCSFGLALLISEFINVCLYNQEDIMKITILAIVWCIIYALVFWLNNKQYAMFQAKVKTAIRNNVIDGILKFDTVTYAKNNRSDYLNDLDKNINSLSLSYFKAIWNFIGSSISFGMSVLIYLWYDFSSVWMIALLMMISFYLPKIANGIIGKKNQTVLSRLDDSNAKVIDYLEGYETIRNFNLFDYTKRNYQIVINDVKKATLELTMLQTMMIYVNIFCGYLATLVILGFASYIAIKNGSPIGYVFLIGHIMGKISNYGSSIVSYRMNMKKSETIIKRYEKYCIEMQPKEHIDQIKRIELVNNSLELDGNLILDNLNYQFNPTKKYLITGSNGSGKSSLLKQLVALKPSSILINGKSIEAYNGNEYYDCVSYLDQNPLLFEASIKDNVTLFGKYELDPKIIDLFLADMDLNRICDNDLSGGEIKRISLARTFLKPADVYILDEPEASLDKESVCALFEYLRTINKGVICVSHSNGYEDIFDEVITIAKHKFNNELKGECLC